MTATDAYVAAYPDASRKSAMVKSHELLNSSEKSRVYKTTVRIRARIAEIRKAVQDELMERVSSCGIAIKERRVLDKNERLAKLKEVIAERAALAEAWQQTVTDLQNEWLNVSEADPECAEKRFAIEQRLTTFLRDIGAGESTGVLARDRKSVADVGVTVFKFDKALYDAMLDLEESVAKELGQIVDKKDVTSGGKPIEPVVIYIPSNGRDTPTAGPAGNMA